ncbi:phosphoinositide phosphatase SAC3 [Cucumis melo var. makuwa]|uniref:Phosphoinositide phosphatase SAC3 n=1 Tax=Cucumis melo var. makuwa TaxID=1194695 RepID=A0A5A7URH5_CUCMM|nr:phosphoinositide phosphatase SAC3 [Cucumis melo var. makuwa]
MNDACFRLKGRSAFKRSLSDGNILHENCSPALSTNRRLEKHSNSVLSKQSQGGSEVLSESSPEISTSRSDIAFSRFDTTISSL